MENRFWFDRLQYKVLTIFDKLIIPIMIGLLIAEYYTTGKTSNSLWFSCGIVLGIKIGRRKQ